MVDRTLFGGWLAERGDRLASVVPKSLLCVCVVAVLAGCGGNAELPSRVAQAPPAKGLPRLARVLFPSAARSTVSRNDLAVHDCGISPTYPCVRAFFALRGSLRLRMALLRAQARRNGWRIVRLRPDGLGLSLELVRPSVHARYVIPRATEASSSTGLELYGPPNTLARPSASERKRWRAAKRRYVVRADAICMRTLGRMKKIGDVAPAVTRAARDLHALRPPAGEEEQVQSFLRPLDTLVQSIGALKHAKGEDVLGPAVALGEYAKRLERAAARYGLRR